MAIGWRIKDPKKITVRLVEGLHDAGDEIFTESQVNVPVDKGMLKRSGTLIKLINGFRIYYRTSYAKRQEFGVAPGTVEHVKKHQVRAHMRKQKNRRKKVSVIAHNRGPFDRTYPKGVPGRFYLTNAWQKVKPRLARFITKLARSQ